MTTPEEIKSVDYFISEATTYTGRMNEIRAKRLEQIMHSIDQAVNSEDIKKYLDEDYNQDFLELIKSCPTALSGILLSIGYRLHGKLHDEAENAGIDITTFEDLDYTKDDDPLSKKHFELLLYPSEMNDPLLKNAISLIRAEAIAHQHVLKQSPIQFLIQEFYLALAQKYRRCGLETPEQLQFFLKADQQAELQKREHADDTLTTHIVDAFTAVETKDLADAGAHPKIAERGASVRIKQQYEQAEPLRRRTLEKIKTELPQLLAKIDKFVPWLLSLESQGKRFFE